MLLAGCSDPYRIAEDAVRAKLADAASADFSGLKASVTVGKKQTFVKAFCGQVQAKGAAGEPGPVQSFYYIAAIRQTDPSAVGPVFHVGDAVVIDDSDQSADGVDAKSMQLALCRGGTEGNPVPTILWE